MRSGVIRGMSHPRSVLPSAVSCRERELSVVVVAWRVEVHRGSFGYVVYRVRKRKVGSN